MVVFRERATPRESVNSVELSPFLGNLSQCALMNIKAFRGTSVILTRSMQ